MSHLSRLSSKIVSHIEQELNEHGSVALDSLDKKTREDLKESLERKVYAILRAELVSK